MVAPLKAERDGVSLHYLSISQNVLRGPGLVKISQEIRKLLRAEKMNLYP